MTTKSAQEFLQRGETYNPDEDGLSFQSWYDVEDVKRLILPQFQALDPEIKKDIVTPYVFFDGAESYNLEDRLSPLVDELYSSDKKYYPFIFKPEISGSHYVAGFLRKSDDEYQTISIILFNPTGTTLRMDYGNYGYNLRLESHDSEEEPNKSDLDFTIDNPSDIYLKIENGLLKYTLLNLEGDQITNAFTKNELLQMGIDIDLSKILSVEVLNDVLKPNLAKILEKTLERGETEEKIEIISSPHKVQTIKRDRDAGKLSSCGPLSVAFISYAIEHPEYMASVGKEFQLPPVLSSLLVCSDAEYKIAVVDLRKQHYEFLTTVQDDLLDVIDESHSPVTMAIISAYEEKQSPGFEIQGDDEYDVDDSELYKQQELQQKETPIVKQQELQETPIVKQQELQQKEIPIVKQQELQQKEIPIVKQQERQQKEIPVVKQQELQQKEIPIVKQQELQQKEIPVVKQQERQQKEIPVVKQQERQQKEIPVVKQQELQQKEIPIVKQQELQQKEIPIVKQQELQQKETPIVKQQEGHGEQLTQVLVVGDKSSAEDKLKQSNDDNPEHRLDVQFVRKQVQRFRDNAKSIFSINNESKADAIEKALNEAIAKGVSDVRHDQGVRDALAIHRIFGFFGCKQTTAIHELEDSLAASPKVK